jgi:hypothetical protein
MLRFRLTCAPHRQAFIEAACRGGCCDPEKMDEIRRRMLAWLSARFPRLVLDHFNEESCIACKLAANGFDLREIERVITEMAMGFVREDIRGRG